METWERRRRPDEVPTPVAVALSDHCRRARSPASAAEIRDALSVLSAEDDFRVTIAAEAEPELSPLSPFAAVDLVRGVEPQLVRKRQDSGYYELVRNHLALRDQKVIEVEVPVVVERPVVSSAPAAPAAPRASKAPSVEDRIAPKKRLRAEITAAETVPTPAEPAQLLPFQERKLNLPRPRGRFTRVGATRARFDTLLHTSFKPELATLIEQSQNRVQLLRVLAESHSGRRGLDLNAGNVLEVITHHGLLDSLVAAERTQVISALGEARGAVTRAAKSVGLGANDFLDIVEGAGLGREVEEVRERFRRELMDAPSLSVRLEHAGRDKYLEDLDIKKRFCRELAADIRRMFEETVAGHETLELATEAVARKYGTAPDLLARAALKLGLTPELQELLPGVPAHTH